MLYSVPQARTYIAKAMAAVVKGNTTPCEPLAQVALRAQVAITVWFVVFGWRAGEQLLKCTKVYVRVSSKHESDVVVNYFAQGPLMSHTAILQPLVTGEGGGVR